MGRNDPMPEIVINTHGPDEMLALASAIGCVLRGGDVVALSGDLGAGTTVFAKGVGRALGVTEHVVSPTFTVVREYEGLVRFVHVDVYRLEHMQELHDVGWDDLLDTDTVVVVEWAERVAARLPLERLDVRIARGDGDDDRRVTIAASGTTWSSRVGALVAAVDASHPGER